jgi:hypothetical protein
MSKSKKNSGDGEHFPPKGPKIEWTDAYAYSDTEVAKAVRLTSGDGKCRLKILFGTIDTGLKEVAEFEGLDACKAAYITFLNISEAMLESRCHNHGPRGSRHAVVTDEEGDKTWVPGPSVGVTDVPHHAVKHCSDFPYLVSIHGYEDLDLAVKGISKKLLPEMPENDHEETLEVIKNLLADNEFESIGCKSFKAAKDLKATLTNHGIKCSINTNESEAFLDDCDDNIF